MELLLASLTSEQLLQAASQAEKYQPITDPAVQELLKGVARVGATSAGSDERKSYMLAQLKSSIHRFDPKGYSLAKRLKRALNNPLAVVEYFHNMIKTIIENVLKEGMFGEVAHYYATIEYQGHGTPHTHLAVCRIRSIQSNNYLALD